jgi:hypothetical protein
MPVATRHALSHPNINALGPRGVAAYCASANWLKAELFRFSEGDFSRL